MAGLLMIIAMFIAVLLAASLRERAQEEKQMLRAAAEKATLLVERQELKLLREERATWQKSGAHAAPIVATAPVVAAAPVVATTAAVPRKARKATQQPAVRSSAQATKGMKPLWLPEPAPKPRKQRKSAAEKREEALLREAGEIAVSADADIESEMDALERAVLADGNDPAQV